MLNRLKQSPFFLFSPFLIYYTYYVVKYKWPVLYGDEPRYIYFANNLLHGYYSPPMPDINLWNGPGYPIVLMPFAALHLPYLYFALLNAVFYYLSIVFLYSALLKFVKPKLAMFAAILWAFYHNIYYLLPAILTEIFTTFLISSFIYSLTLYYTTRKKRYLVLTGVLLGYLALTKILMGYVLIICLTICLLLWLISKRKFYFKQLTLIMAISLLVTIPYLFYTYNLTKKPFYWGNSGGMSLYWMSSPFENEFGDWKMANLSNTLSPMPFKTTEGDSLLKANHLKEMTFILAHTGVAQDSIYKKLAVQNIKSHPKKFIKNYIYNICRMLFDFPYSYNYQLPQTIQNIIIGSLVFWSSITAGIICMINWRKIIYPVKFAMLIFTVYFLISGLASAYARMFDVFVPILIFWITYTLGQIPKVSFRFADIKLKR